MNEERIKQKIEKTRTYVETLKRDIFDFVQVATKDESEDEDVVPLQLSSDVCEETSLSSNSDPMLNEFKMAQEKLNSQNQCYTRYFTTRTGDHVYVISATGDDNNDQRKLIKSLQKANVDLSNMVTKCNELQDKMAASLQQSLESHQNFKSS